MGIPDYTLVCGVDAYHLRQLLWVIATWKKHKPSMLERPAIVFFDRDDLECREVSRLLRPYMSDLLCVAWPLDGVTYSGGNDKWTNPQRYKMLAGFVHVAASLVSTKYWLKMDTDVVAKDRDDWIDPNWFVDDPAIVSHRWTFTRPANQLEVLDQWVEDNKKHLPEFDGHPPLDMHPKPGADRIGHRRIISWCAFFRQDYTAECAAMANRVCGCAQLPVPSQDGYMWYVAKRRREDIRLTNMKSRGWQQWHTNKNIRKSVLESLGEPADG